jgi:hypothetical protein
VLLEGTKLHYKSPTAGNEGTFCASEWAGIEPTPPAPKGAGYVRLDHSATVDIDNIVGVYGKELNLNKDKIIKLN